MSNSLQPHESQHARPHCSLPTPRVYSNSCPSGRWCHPTISSSVVTFSSCPHSLPASGSFPMSQLFAWGGQSTGVSASASVLPMNTQDWSPLGWTGSGTEVAKCFLQQLSKTYWNYEPVTVNQGDMILTKQDLKSKGINFLFFSFISPCFYPLCSALSSHPPPSSLTVYLSNLNLTTFLEMHCTKS